MKLGGCRIELHARGGAAVGFFSLNQKTVNSAQNRTGHWRPRLADPAFKALSTSSL